MADKEYASNEDFINECKLTYGDYVPTGKFAHFCLEWDGLPIDETQPEFQFCDCFEGEEFEAAKQACEALFPVPELEDLKYE